MVGTIVLLDDGAERLPGGGPVAAVEGQPVRHPVVADDGQIVLQVVEPELAQSGAVAGEWIHSRRLVPDRSSWEKTASGSG
jgi:hypothetical protein